MSRFDSASNAKLFPIVHLAQAALGIELADLENPEHPINNSSTSGKKDGSIINCGYGQLRVAAGSEPSAPWFYLAQQHDIPTIAVRKKSEVVWTGVSVVIPTTETNLIGLLKANTPTSGEYLPFFDTTANKMVVFPEDETLHFKLVVVGTWAVGANRSIQLTFPGEVPDIIVDNRNDAVTVDNLTFPTFFSVDADGFLANNGSAITIKANGGIFTATTIKLIAEQHSVSQ